MDNRQEFFHLDVYVSVLPYFLGTIKDECFSFTGKFGLASDDF